MTATIHMDPTHVNPDQLVDASIDLAAKGGDKDSSLTQQVDIAIVGGAMTGATLALALSTFSQGHSGLRPLSVALIEAHLPDSKDSGFDARSIALAHGSIMALTRLGLWAKLAPLGTPIHHIHVSDRGHFGMTELTTEQFDVSALGQVVELARVGQVLHTQLLQSEVHYYCPAKLDRLEASVDAHTLVLDTGKRIKAKLVVAADGLYSKVRTSFQLPITQTPFDQTAIIANICTDKPHQYWAFERFTQTGPLALLPMSDVQGRPRLSLVWALAPATANKLYNASKAEFLTTLQQAFGYRAGKFIDVSERYTYPLNLSYMPRPMHHRCVFVGNAAQTLHPIAGQGFNLGLRDVIELMNILKSAWLAGEDVGATAVTHSYVASREQDRHNTRHDIEWLVRIFSNAHWPLVVGRNLGLRLLSWLPPLKYPVAAQAMGWQSSRSA